MYAEPAVRLGSGPEVPADRLHPLPHPQQPVPGADGSSAEMWVSGEDGSALTGCGW
jgi:hypothetical protein